MRALLDEQLSSEIAVELRPRGLDVEAVSEREAMRGLRDEQVLEVASGEGRAVVTNNVKDYRPVAARRLTEGRGHGGLILLPSTRSRSRAAVHALADGVERIMRDNPGGLDDSERWVAPAQ